MPLPRFHNLSEDKQRAILDAAAAEFAQHGFDGASFNRIIAAAGISKGAMYYYFADKADAYGAVLDDVLARMAGAVGDLAAPADADGYWALMAGGMGRLTRIFFADPQLAALARSLYRSSGGRGHERLLERLTAWVEQLLALGQRLGAVRDDAPRELLVAAVTGLLVSMDRWFADAIEQQPPEALAPLVPKTLELVRDLLAPRRKQP